MPRDSNGVFSLPSTYLAVLGETIQPAQHNPPLEDIATALTNSLPRNGAAPMTGPMRVTDGTPTSPGMQFSAAPGTGIYRTAEGALAIAVGGVKVAEFSLTAVMIPVGSVMDFMGTTAPAGWLFAFGQNLSRTTYAELWAVLGSPNTGDGSTTFTMPDLRGRVTVGKDDMGGGVIGRITSAGSGVDGKVLGAVGGDQSHTLTIAEMPAHDHGGGGNTGSTTPTTNASTYTSAQAVSFGSPVAVPTAPAGASVSAHTHTYAIPSQGSGSLFSMLQPSIITNKIIYARA